MDASGERKELMKMIATLKTGELALDSGERKLALIPMRDISGAQIGYMAMLFDISGQQAEIRRLEERAASTKFWTLCISAIAVLLAAGIAATLLIAASESAVAPALNVISDLAKSGDSVSSASEDVTHASQRLADDA